MSLKTVMHYLYKCIVYYMDCLYLINDMLCLFLKKSIGRLMYTKIYMKNGLKNIFKIF